MMDTVYGTKKYFQTLSGNGSDNHRHHSTSRVMHNDYVYQNTFGRMSSFGPYQHMNNNTQISCGTDLSSQYGYNTWGLWRDQRNLPSSIYSTKSQHSSIKSFSILLLTAAFIIILSIITIAVLAFYFGSVKSDLGDPIMAFEGHFRVTKGDTFTTGLKYNRTSTYKQKVDFYRKMVERSLSNNGLQVVKVDILGFGNGPLIEPHFRSILDMKKLPLNIGTIEEHIRESIMREINTLRSIYQTIRLDLDSIEIKRILDENVMKSSLYSNVATNLNSQNNAKKKLQNKLMSKLVSSTTKPKVTTKATYVETDIDVENAPVIQGSFEGSFEITKTDADITRKKVSPTSSVTKEPIMITQFPMRLKPNKNPTIEKVSSPKLTSILTTPPRTTSSSSSATKKDVLVKKVSNTLSLETTSATGNLEKIGLGVTDKSKKTINSDSVISDSSEGTEAKPDPSDNLFTASAVLDLKPPNLDLNLFTSSPALDTEPWRPIKPSSDVIPTKPSMYSVNLDAIKSGLLPRHKIKFSEQITDNPEVLMFYHSFTNPIFMPSTSGIEWLGNSDVRPHPLPIPLIDDVMVPNFKPMKTTSDALSKLNAIDDPEKFELIGDGVIVRKHDIKDPVTVTNYEKIETISENPKIDSANKTTEINLGDLLLNLFENSNQQQETNTEEIELVTEINSKDDPVEVRIRTNSSEKNKELPLKIERLDQIESEIEHDIPKLNFQNSQKRTINRSKYQNISKIIESDQTIETTTVSKNSRTTKPPNIKPTISSIDDSFLFPTHSKLDYFNGSFLFGNRDSGSQNILTKKVFNDTLQAWIVENNEDFKNFSLKMEKSNASNIQGISLIFDTLASKLDITPSIATKSPPLSPNKLKQTLRNELLFAKENVSSFDVDALISNEDDLSKKKKIFDEMSPEIIVGEAEVEVIDPKNYDEMLKTSETILTTTDALVTLLPVKSNSGLRTFIPHSKIINNDRKFGFSNLKEAVVRAGVHITI